MQLGSNNALHGTVHSLRGIFRTAIRHQFDNGEIRKMSSWCGSLTNSLDFSQGGVEVGAKFPGQGRNTGWLELVPFETDALQVAWGGGQPGRKQGQPRPVSDSSFFETTASAMVRSKRSQLYIYIYMFIYLNININK